MRTYIIRRLLLMIPTLIGITLVTFLVIQLVPGGPIEQALQRAYLGGGEAGQAAKTAIRGENSLTEEDLNILKEFYGFDKPVMARYWLWLKNVAQFNFGDSYRYSTPVLKILADKIPVSCYYGLLTTLLIYIICIPLGILKAVRHRSLFDNTTSVLVLLGFATPPFAFGFLLFILFASYWSIFPLGGFVSDNFAALSLAGKIGDLFMHSVLPLSAYLVGGFAWMTLLMKNSLMENMSADFVRTAVAKGLSPRGAIVKHAARNALIPIATSFGSNISAFLMGSFLIETVFNIDGMGLLGYTSIVERDYPVVMALLFIGSLLTLVGNLLSDICVAFVDPRVRFE